MRKLGTRERTILERLFAWAGRNGVELAVGGSAAYSSGGAAADVDVLLLNLPVELNARTFALPPGFDRRAWPTFLNLYRRRRAHVFGCWHTTVSGVRLECYPQPVLDRILRLRRFTVRRLKRGPLGPKACVLEGTNGARRTVTINPEPIGLGMYSTVPNVLANRGVLFIGMHVDRLLTSIPILSTTRLDELRRTALRVIGLSIEKHAPASARLAREPECVFFAASRFSRVVRIDLRAQMLGRPARRV